MSSPQDVTFWATSFEAHTLHSSFPSTLPSQFPFFFILKSESSIREGLFSKCLRVISISILHRQQMSRSGTSTQSPPHLSTVHHLGCPPGKSLVSTRSMTRSNVMITDEMETTRLPTLTALKGPSRHHGSADFPLPTRCNCHKEMCAWSIRPAPMAGGSTYRPFVF